MARFRRLLVRCVLVSCAFMLILVQALLPHDVPRAVAASPFPDIEGHWAEAEIVSMQEKGWLQGYPDGTFRPQQAVSRAEFIALLSRAMALPEARTQALPFDDVAGHWVLPELRAVFAAGILHAQDYAGTSLLPDAVIQRQEMARMMARALGLSAEAAARRDQATSFRDDAEIAAADRGYVNALVAFSLMTGYEDYTFRPRAALSRSEAAVMLYRADAFSRDATAQLDRAAAALAEDDLSLARRHLLEAARVELDDDTLLTITPDRLQRLSERLRSLHEAMEERTAQLLSERALHALDSLRRRDRAAFGELVHPERGVLFSPYAYVDFDEALRFDRAFISELFTSNERHEWGAYDGTGDPIELTFAEYADRFIYTAFTAAERDAAGYNRIVGEGNTLNNVFDVFPDALVVEFHHAGSAAFDFMDWRSLRLVFAEHEDGAWYLIAVINDQWTI